MNNPESIEQNLLLSKLLPKKLLEGLKPRLIDEWQLAPKLWDAIRFDLDESSEFGQYILTGSSLPVNRKEITHSGTGRFTWIKMRTMSLFESEESNGSVSLKQLFDNKEISGTSTLSLDQIAHIICRGGWPLSLDLNPDLSLNLAKDYFEAVVKIDINKVDNSIKDSNKVRKFMKSYARNQGSQISNVSLSKDVNNNSLINENTVVDYIKALSEIFVIEEMEAWNPNLRSKTAIRTSNTRYFVDPSIAAASLGIGPNDLIQDLNTYGLMFETLCIRDLRIYTDLIGGEVYHYRDKSGLECDAVIHLRNGNYGLIEIKLGSEELIEIGAKNLKKLANKIDTDKMKEPTFLWY